MGGKVHVRPGLVVDAATIVIRDGLIEAVGKEVKPPDEARVWDLKGFTVYAGFIDAYLTCASVPPASQERLDRDLTAGATGFFGVSGSERDPGQPGPGNEIAQITPERRVGTTYTPDAKILDSLRQVGFTAGNVVPERGILRGTSALIAFSDANPNDALIKADVFQHAVFAADSGARAAYPASLMGILAVLRQTFFDAEHYAREHADHEQRPEGRVRPAFNPSLQALKPVLEKRTSLVVEPRSALMVDRAAHLIRELGLNAIFVSSGQEWRRPQLAKAAGGAFVVPLNFPELSKLPEDDDWNGVTLDQLRVWDWAAENPAVLRKQHIEIALTTYGLSDRKSFRKNLRSALDRGLSEEDALAALTVVPARLCGVDKQAGTIEPGKLANLTVVAGSNYFNPENKVDAVWIDGRIYRVEHEKLKQVASTGKASVNPSKEADDKTKETESKASDERANKETTRRDLLKNRVARSPQHKRNPLAEPRGILIRDATIWTCGPAQRIEKGSLLIVDGKISKVSDTPISEEAGLPAGSLLVIDGRGKHVTPGIIDAHSHAMILGGVNESTLPSTAMVRVSDVVNSETDNIYRQLAGGVTAANLLHGSANPIGGQNCLIKLKEGAAPADLKIPGAPSGIKFALGENVKQSNSGERNTTRFPQTRMGVRTFFANRFIAAKQYLQEWDKFKANGGRRPRRDLELEALGEILEGKRWIHCHSYRQDEILMFLRLMEDFGVKVGTLQHVLEGYKVADEIAKHGAGASAFSDWWGYKFEVYDAIPYAGSLMRDRGVLVSFNSDDADLARRLYLEAAKAVKYGNTSEEEALKFVTLNPAKQLRIQKRIGSLEAGKDADFVIWSQSPLDSGTVCLETWIEGKKYFDRALDAERSADREKEWNALLAKAKKVLDAAGPSDKSDARAQSAFFEHALEYRYDYENRHCDHE